MSSNDFQFSVQSGSRTYQVIVGIGALNKISSHLNNKNKPGKVCTLTDANVDKLYKSQIESALSDTQHTALFLPSGEGTKSFSTLYPYYEKFILDGLDRHSTLVAIGGGVTGDAVGFLASTYLRGVNFIQVPTTLLSMVDSSIGGKVGINHELGKNLIGSFYPPELVIIDPAFLVELPEREYKSGLSECIKHALISSPELFSETINLKEKLSSKNLKILPEYIFKNLQIKKAVVEADEKEAGIRAYLNFGHTFAHALENYFSYGTLLHGEAVGLGMLCALRLSEITLGLNKDLREELSNLLTHFNLPTKIASIDISKLCTLITRDKKSQDGKVNFVLLKDLGKAALNSSISDHDLKEAWEVMRV